MNTPDEKHRDQDSTLRFISNVTFGFTKAERRASARFTLWTFAWAFSAIFTITVIQSQLLSEQIQWIASAIPSLFLLMTIRSYVGFFKIADELTVKIHLEAFAFAVAACFFFFTGYALAELQGARELSTADTFGFLALSVGTSQFCSAWRYR